MSAEKEIREYIDKFEYFIPIDGVSTNVSREVFDKYQFEQSTLYGCNAINQQGFKMIALTDEELLNVMGR